ncbi:MAG TPA: DUF1573 domain-containing protein [Gemmataceae bacterium]|nr:DUF1573 domain-containing protein [Gemmataceae bacterium]
MSPKIRTFRRGLVAVLLSALLGCKREVPPATPDMDQSPVEAKAEMPTSPVRAVDKAEPTAASGSRLRIETWEFGVIAPKTELRHRYTIHNNSNITWTIKQVTPSCSCTCGEFSQRTIKPSESTSVEVVFRTGDRDGTVYQAVMIEFAQTAAPFFQLAMKGEIRSLLSPSPSRVDFGRVWASKNLRQSIQLRNYSEQDIQIGRIDAPDWLQAEAQPGDRPSSGNPPRQIWNITVQADLSRFPTVADEPKLVIHTNAATLDPVVIPVHVELRPALEIVPNAIDFHVLATGISSQQALVLDISPEGGELSEKDLVLTHSLGEEMKIHVLKIGLQNRFRLTATYRPKQSKGAVRGELQIKVRDKDTPPARVPISALVR